MFVLLQSSSEQGKAPVAASDSTDLDTLESPSDIYSRFSPYFGPKSILKGKTEHKKQRQKKRSERKVAFETDRTERQAKLSERKVQVTKQVRFVKMSYVVSYVFGVSNQVQHKQGCLTTEDG